LKKNSENFSKEIIEKLIHNNILNNIKNDDDYYGETDEYYEDDEEYCDDEEDEEYEDEYYEDGEEYYFNILKNKYQKENKINIPKSKSVEENYEDSNLVIKMFMMIIILFLVFVVVFVVFKNNNLNAKLSLIEERLAEKSILSYEEKIKELNFKVLELTEENDKLKSQLEINNKINKESTENTEKEERSDKKIIPNEYIVQKGDSVWKISKKIYGSADYYYKILEANGLNEKSSLKLGQKLIIPML